ncbi:hypothetical protein HA520_18035 [Azotobacter chroococcum]|uniref:Uncharacterized protein n=1 Tax=Azotobacter chroococcum TaxID=353 RepID=A0AA44C7V5_9GAMM|nr:hypothetical protein [Azotobacter chroococcum]
MPLPLLIALQFLTRLPIHFPWGGLLACTFLQGTNLLERVTADVTGMAMSHPGSGGYPVDGFDLALD